MRLFGEIAPGRVSLPPSLPGLSLSEGERRGIERKVGGGDPPLFFFAFFPARPKASPPIFAEIMGNEGTLRFWAGAERGRGYGGGGAGRYIPFLPRDQALPPPPPPPQAACKKVEDRSGVLTIYLFHDPVDPVRKVGEAFLELCR